MTPVAMFDDLQDDELGSLVRHCLEEWKNSREKANAGLQCFQLFNFAAKENNFQAWLCICEIYRGLVVRWIENHKYQLDITEDTDSLVDCTFDNAWNQFRKPGKFNNFPSIAKVMNYIKACARTCVREVWRKNRLTQSYERSEEGMEGLIIERELSNRVRERMVKLWQPGDSEKEQQSRKEQIIVQEYFEWEIPPREIFERHRDLFNEIQEVYRVKRNFLERLARDPVLQKMGEEFL